MKRIAIVGAGFSGSVIAHQLARAGCEIDIFDTRPHVAGNCHTERDSITGVMVHTYGPHIFHTSNQTVWDFVRQFDEFMPFTNRVKAIDLEFRKAYCGVTEFSRLPYRYHFYALRPMLLTHQ